MFLIVGLGNPGAQYEKTRHNAGRVALKQFLSAHDFSIFEKDKHAKAVVAKGVIGGELVTVLYPETYMNASGSSVRHMIEKRGVGANDVVVVYDDIDLPIGECRISFGRGSGGHNGVASIIQASGTKEFVRVRIGVAPVSFFGKMKKPNGEGVVSKFLLSNFTSGELKKIEKVGERVKDALTAVIIDGHEKAMNQFN